MTKYLWLLLIFTINGGAFGQKISGIVTDKSTKRRIASVIITVGQNKTITDPHGQFELATAGLRDSLKINHFGYKPYAIRLNKTDTVLLIALEPASISLKEVTIKEDKSFKKDSAANRLTNEKEFNYIGPTVADAFKGGGDRQPGELFSINPIVLVQALTKKSSREYKFKQKLILDEQADYVDRKFNGSNVARITGLKRDILSTFLVNYRPSYKFAKKSTGYEMDVYIKQSFVKFKKDGMKADNLLVNAQ